MASQPDGSPVTPTPRHRQSGVERPFALHPPGMALGTGSSHHYRFSEFDEGAFSESSGVSADQAKRALRAHLAETERRMAEAGRLGTSLVQQQKDLTEKLREVEELQAESELSPELKKKLAELEKEYDDVARETARAFLPKQRVPSNESTGSPEGRGGRRSLSPVKYESHTSHGSHPPPSPTKLTMSNRKQRNQATNRVHDIEFAAEISTSLISQVRGLQALLAEREEELRDTRQDVARLEDNSDNLKERIKELSEGEHRYKEENWNLETRIHDLEAAQRDAADNEKKVSQQLATVLADKTKVQRELDELKATHSRIIDDHAASVKLHDIELGTAKRNMAMADTDKTSLQKKVDELTSQNQELARAVAIQQRSRAVDQDGLAATSEEDVDNNAENATPEHSPPTSPVKNTPRHSVLETETLKTSLLHSQRTLQSLRTNLHREKTEKLELRRMLQDARDELERARADPNPPAPVAPKKSRKEARDAHHNRRRPSQLGVARTSRIELIPTPDPEWEELDEVTPSSVKPTAGHTDASDQFDTANEAQLSDTSFATAKDGADTADDFHTGAENQSSDEDTLTETEKDTTRRRTLAAKTGASTTTKNVQSVEMEDPANQSTASTSDDDDDYSAPRTPTASLYGSSNNVSRMRLRVSRSSLVSRRLRHMSSVEETGSPGGLQSSPFSGADSPATPATIGIAASSNNSTPRVNGPQQSLFAELGGLGEDSDEEVASDGTPMRFRSPRHLMPSSFTGSNSSGNSAAHSLMTQISHSPLVVMVDRSTLTDAVTILPWSAEVENDSLGFDLNAKRPSRPSSVVSFNTVNMDETLNEFPSPPSTSWKQAGILTPVVLSPPRTAYSTRSIEVGTDAYELVPDLTISDVFSVPIEPVSEPELPQPSPVLLALSAMQTEHVTPKMPPTPEPVEAPVFTESALHIVDITPIELPPPVVPIPVPAVVVLPKEEPPVFSFSAIQQQAVEPIAEPEPEPTLPEPLSVSVFHSQHVIPIAEPEPVAAREIPVVIPAPVLEPLSFSGVQAQHVQPVAEPELEVARAVVQAPEPLSFSAVQVQHVEPVAEAEPEVVAVAVAVPAPVILSYSDVQTRTVEPVAEPEVPPAEFSFSAVQAEHVVPVATPKKPLPAMDFSSVFSQHVQPVIVEEPEKEVVSVPAVSSMATQTDEWKPEPSFAALGAVGVGAGLLGVAASSASINEEMAPRSPKRNGFIMPREFGTISALDGSLQPSTPNKGALGSMHGWSKLNGPSTPVIAEDETRQSPSDSPIPETPESQRPFREITTNGVASRYVQQPRMHDLAEDEIFSPSSPPSVIRNRPQSGSESQDSTGKQAAEAPTVAVSSNGQMANGFALPPLPTNHREVIEAARSGSASSGAAGDAASGMGLSTWRVHTPTGTREPPVFAPLGVTPTPKANTRASGADARPASRVSSRANASNGGGNVGTVGTLSRQTSMSSFASEVDARFNIHDGTDVFGSGHHTDPRMIQAITQTMIGEYLWKYTRKTGRSGLSENRHRRYFWIHPYTRMLYWSDNGPTAGNRAEQRAKSVVIEGVRVVTDDNPMPPGLHRKSLIVISPGRTIKFTCPTGHRHEIWFNALSYLLLRNDEVPEDGPSADGDHITREDVEEFNPPFAPRSAQQPRRPPLSLSSYNSRTTRNESPAFDVSVNIPTLTKTPKTPKKKTSTSALTPSASAAALSSRRRLSRIGGYWRSTQSLSAQFNSLRGRSSALSHRHPTQGGSIYEASEVTDSAEELRALYEAQDRAADRLDNVRACCDGKHDVGNLHHHHATRRNRHSHGVSSLTSTPTHV